MTIFVGADASNDPRERYGIADRGGGIWRDADLESAEGVEHLLQALVETRRTQPRPEETVFVSHRSMDLDHGLAIARFVADRGVEYWIDECDATLGWVNAGGAAHLPDRARVLLVACAIETGLLNSTHLVAVMTPNTTGGWWVPYEYGRVKESAMYSHEVSAWFRNDLLASYAPGLASRPEWLHLGDQHDSQAALVNWLPGPLQSALPVPAHWPMALPN